DPQLGSGSVKITPGQEFNEFEVAKRAGINAGEMLNMFDAAAQVVQTADGLVPDKYLGQDRFVVRSMIVADMKAAGFLVPHLVTAKDGEVTETDFEPRTIATPFGDRGGVVIEPWLTDQWYVDAQTLAQPPMQAVRDGRIEIVPKTWEKTFFNWMENIQPWCVSRQLWWGHRIPAWYAEDGSIFVAETEEEALTLAAGKALARDNDVLDTWFSSALWPFATLGWPEENAALYQRHYPNDLLISGFDILFFWCARMAMQGMHFNNGQVPWKRLYLHGLVRAADGQKMSKSKGNVVDPLGLIDQYGADALRFFMAAMESQGRDVKMDERRVEGYRNFATKLWNAARFCQSNGIGASTSIAAPAATLAVNQWIIGEVVETLAELDKAMADLRFDAASGAIYHFVWDQFCDWYIELVKGNFDTETKAVAGWVLDQILVMLHPFMPFVTEELWGSMGERAGYPLITAKWPEPGASVSAEAKREVEWLIALVGNLRTAKNELGIAPGAKLDAFLPEPSDATRGIIERNAAAIDRLARLNAIQFAPAPAGAAMQIGAGDANIVVPLEGVVDIAAEKARLAKALEVSTKEAKSLEGRLNNPAFVEKAKPEAVDKARADHAAHAAEAERLAAALGRLG
ncbi:MAG: valyl-tRNA synthetase, partial [Novosphingobium sp.]|nr:valyl-tRNA synthetase [Novosphingobium sp.]